MTKISICIPVEKPSDDAVRLITTLLANRQANLDIIVAGPAVDQRTDLGTIARDDARLRLLPVDASLDRQKIWKAAATAATGDWITLINPSDMLESDIELVAAYVEQTSPETDAIAWNTFQIAPDAVPETAGSIAIPASYHINTLDKTAMLKAFFYWEGSLDTPKMPFGLYHSLIRRSLMHAILEASPETTWSTPLPQFEWAARVLLFAEQLAFCSRPLSAIETVVYQPPAVSTPPQSGFPFHAAIGITAAVAEVQYYVLAELGSDWGGGDAAFVRACMIDCMKEHGEDAFNAKGEAYFAALQRFAGPQFAATFQPGFSPNRVNDRRRGLHGEALLVDRFIGGARTAQDLFAVMRSMIAPIGLICGGAVK
ncbi:glycosyltransferase family 2 protein [Pararhizobium sp.]|uniref:glycosyltransferase family 2 protein n=1 Tax=Pararhizobium sp. TaxID=1977563 RepID=UPI00271CEA21|nr:hypothetical protein [Pararhizobium sp.]MDO9416269.1 hypothetical protein [Pararhizobium sp.]